METIVLLGSTGSIGSSVIDVLSSYPGKFRLAGVSAHKNLRRFGDILRKFSPGLACLPEENREFTDQFPSIEFVFGESGLTAAAGLPSAGTIVIGISGIAGLSPTLAAVRAGKRILSANKESIVAAGDIINRALSESGLFIIPQGGPSLIKPLPRT
jgi:1-deoxy-D-xylulose-5-phosphate reductoisomerase